MDIIIGSYALNSHGYNTEPQDIDLLVSLETAKLFLLKFDYKSKNIFWFENSNIKYDIKIINPEDKSSDKLIMDFCTENNSKKINLLDHDFLIPPLEILYLTKKSHIHRILPITGNIIKDTDIWKRHMAAYNFLRNKINYQEFDKILYDNIDNPDNFYKNFYYTRFQELNNRVPDTKISMDKSESEFFKDGVPRIINHDLLHEKIAQLNRSTNIPLFKKFQNPGSVELDQAKFLAEPYSNQIQTIREEIQVLFLERKLLLNLSDYKKSDKIYCGYDPDLLIQDFDQITAHFITNLCGNGHYWLRRFCLDHYHTLGDPAKYDFKNLEFLACEITGINYTNGKIIYNFTIQDLISEGLKYGLDNLKIQIKTGFYNPNPKSITKLIDSYFKTNNNSTENIPTEYNIGSGIVYSLVGYSILNNHENYSNKFSITNFSLHLGLDPDNNISKDLTRIIDLIISDYLIGEFGPDNNFLVYSLDHGLGFYYHQDKSEYKIFSLGLAFDSTIPQVIKISGKYMELFSDSELFISDNLSVNNTGINIIDTKFRHEYDVKYYSSESCTEQPPNEVEINYISYFGKNPEFISNLTEFLARIILRVSRDDPHD